MTQSMPRLVRVLIAGAGLAALSGAVQAAPAAAATAKTTLMATVQKFTDDFNKGDAAAAKADSAQVVSIIDEIPPHAWSGAAAYDTWLADFAKDSQARGVTNEKVTTGPVVRAQIDGDSGYLVGKVTYTYKQHGKAMIEQAQWTFALSKARRRLDDRQLGLGRHDPPPRRPAKPHDPRRRRARNRGPRPAVVFILTRFTGEDESPPPYPSE